MLIQSIRLNYNVNPNTKYLNYIEHQIKFSNYKRIQFIPSNYNKLRIKTSNYSHFKLDPSQIYFELVLLQINCVQINRAF